jgi:O-antigen/teichoic acid export membrane protein
MKEPTLTTHEASVTTKNISTVTLLKVAQYPFLILSLMFIPRIMGKEVYGEYALLISIITMTASLIDFGGGTDIFGRFVPEFQVQGQPERIAKLSSGILALKGIIDLFTVLVLFPILYLSYGTRFSGSYFLLVVAIVLVRDWQTVPYALLFGLNRLVWFASQDPMRRALSLVFILLLFHYFGLFGAVLSTFVVECCLGVFAFYWTHSYFSLRDFRVDLNFLKPYISFHAFFYISAFLLNAWQRLGNPLIASMAKDSAQISLFDIPNQIFLITATFTLVVIASLTPIFTKLLLIGKEGKIAAWSRLILKYTAVFCVMTLSGFLLAGRDLIPLIIGPAYREIFPNGVVLLSAMFPMSIVQLGQVFSVVYKRPGIYLKALCGAISTFLVISVMLIPSHASMGCSIATLTSCIVLAALMCLSFGSKLIPCLADSFKVIALGGILAAFLPFRGTLVTNLLLVVCMAVTYCLLLFATRVLNLREVKEVIQALKHKTDLEV